MGCGCGQGARYSGREEPKKIKPLLRGLSTHQLKALEASVTTPQAVADQIKRIRFGDISDGVVETTDVVELEREVDEDEEKGLLSDHQVVGVSSEDSVHMPPPIPSPSATPSRASAKNYTTTLGDSPLPLPDSVDSKPRWDSPKSSASAVFTDASMSMNSADFDLLGRRLIDEAHTSDGTTYRDADVIWVHPKSGARLLLGSQKVANSRELLEEHGVSCIVCCLDLDEKGPFESDPSFEYLHFPISWWKRTSLHRSPKGIGKILAPLLGFVERSLEQGRNVFIHCLAGAHRAGTAGIACLMHLCQLDTGSAVLAVQAVRPCVEPLAHLHALLKRLAKSRQAGCVEPAIKAAEARGFDRASRDLFASLA